jgi:multidrug efflux system outer membrane protein
MKNAHALILGIALVTAACTTVGPDYQRPGADLPSAFADAKEAGQPALGTDWWRLYGDARLDELVASALERNADLKLAIARIEETDANLREAGAAFLPEIDLAAQGTRQRVSTTQATPIFAGFPIIRNNVRLALSTSF